MLEEEEVDVQYLTESKRSSSENLPQSIPSSAAGSKRSSIVESLSSKKDEASLEVRKESLIRRRSASGRESIEVPRSERRRSRLASTSEIVAPESEQGESKRDSITRSRGKTPRSRSAADLEVKRLSTATNMSEDTIAQITDIEEDANLVSEQEEKTLSLKSEGDIGSPEIYLDNGKDNMPLFRDDPHCKFSHELSDKSSSLKSY